MWGRDICAAAAALVVAAISATVGLTSPATAQSANPITMKLSTATINDTQHEWLQRFAAAVEKDSGGRIKAEIYPASQLGAIPRQIEGVQFGSIQGWIGPPEFLVGVDERYQALSAPGLFTSQDQDVRVINDPPVRDMMLGLGRRQGTDRRRAVADRAVLDRLAQADSASRRLQGPEDPRAGVAVPAGNDQADGRLAGGDDAWPTCCRHCSRAPSTARLPRSPVHDFHYHRCGEIRARERPALSQLDYRHEQEMARRLAAGSAEDHS